MCSAKELEHYQRVRAQFEQPDDKSNPPPDPEQLEPGTSYHFEQAPAPEQHPAPPQLKIDRKGKGRAVPINYDIGSSGSEKAAAAGGSAVNGDVMRFGEGVSKEEEDELYGE